FENIFRSSKKSNRILDARLIENRVRDYFFLENNARGRPVARRGGLVYSERRGRPARSALRLPILFWN
ncbi:hypothetical protein, partial [Burkholderia mallei]